MPTKRAKEFRRLREALGLTQHELAEALEYANDTVISQKENDHRAVTPRDLLAMECLLRRARKWPLR